MQIAFDATVLHGRKSGIGYYCEELLRSMAVQDHETDFFVFSHQPLQLRIPGANGNVRCTSDRTFPIRAFYLHAMLPRVLDRVRPDLCHYTNFLAPIGEQRPYVVTLHDMGLESLAGCHPLPKRLYTRRLIPRVAKGARLILTNSEFSKWEIVRYLHISEDRIRVTPLAASAEFHPAPESSETQNQVPYFLFVGNLEPRKNLQRLIEAFALVKASGHELWIVGNAWYRAGAIRERARALGISERVRFLGYVPREDLPGLYRGAAAFVYPSLLEGFGLPVVEAMACGTPVITSNNSSLKEIAGSAALLVDAESVQSIANAMGMLSSDTSERARLRALGLRRAADYSWEKTAALTLDAYREAVAGRPARSTRRVSPDEKISVAIRNAVGYAATFDYPLTVSELYERLYEVSVDRATFERRLASERLPLSGEFVVEDAESVRRRIFREEVSDRAVERAWPGLKFLSSIPFVRMLSFSGSTAHRNMNTEEDLDLFMVVEDGKVWFVFLIAILWAKLRGVRRIFCLNYVLSNVALPLVDHDAFTAHQAASLKPVFGKGCYDQFLQLNPFVRRAFPNFESKRHREMYPEIEPSGWKRWMEFGLRLGPVQCLDRLIQGVLGWHLRRKRSKASGSRAGDVFLEPRRLKLHFHSHREETIRSREEASGATR